jgi:hypothetical protein
MEGKMMRHLVECFQKNRGRRGVTFYDSENCNFLTWAEVFKFVNSLPTVGKEDEFTDRLTTTLANYNPDTEFLAVQQNGDSVSVELYSQAR